MPQVDTFLYAGGKGELTASAWESEAFVAMLISDSYAPHFQDTIAMLEAVELAAGTPGYERKLVTGRRAVLDAQSDRWLLEASNLLWANLGPPTNGPIVQGVAIVRGDVPIAYFRMPARTLNGVNYGLNTKPNQRVLLRLA